MIYAFTYSKFIHESRTLCKLNEFIRCSPLYFDYVTLNFNNKIININNQFEINNLSLPIQCRIC